jgi:hypothetical protein
MKVKLSPGFIKQHPSKVYGGVNVELPTLLTLSYVELSAERPGHFNPVEKTLVLIGYEVKGVRSCGDERNSLP